MASIVDLGFVEQRTPWKLRSKFFPSKVGGKPAWLRLNHLPDRTDLLCSSCKNPLSFLMQAYAHLDGIESAFHRMVFIFMCSDGKCCRRFSNESFVVLRSQLPRKNDFYSFEPPAYKEKFSCDPSADKYQPMCIVCGCVATLKCTNCSNKDYCCEAHRSIDWEHGHNAVCGKEQGAVSKHQNHPFLLPEYDLVTEEEELPAAEPEKSDELKMNEYRQFMQSSKAPKEMQDMPLDDLDCNLKKNDKAFNKFQKRVNLEPEQVLRYQKGGMPLWVSSEHVPEPKDIPDCSCGAKRIFEFQVMPQLLNYLSLDAAVDSVDWGTLAIYTCSNSCDLGTENYVKEFLWKQDFSQDDTKQ